MKSFDRSCRAILCLTISAGAIGLIPGSASAAQITWAHVGNESPAYVELLQKYQKKSGNTVKMVVCQSTNDLTNILLDSPPDLISMNPNQMTEYVEMGIFADMSKELASSKGVINDLIPSAVKAYSSGRKIYALPWSSQVTALRYNVDMFKKAGVRQPSASWRYTEEYYAAMKKLTKDTDGDKKIDQYGLVGSPMADWLPLVYSFGAKIISEDGKKFMFSGKEAVQSIDFIKKLHKEGLAKTFDWRNRDENAPIPFLDGKVGTIISNWRMMGNDIKFKVGVVVPPKGPKGSFTSMEAAGIGIFNKSKKKKQAADFAKYMASPEAQIILFKKDGIIPTSMTALQSKELRTGKTDIDESLLRALPKAKAMTANPALRRSFGLNYGLMDYINGDISANDFISQLKERVEQAISNSTW